MKTEARLESGLKELLQSGQALDELSVIHLCAYLGVSRQTFYYHFRDIYDLVQSSLLNDPISIGNKSLAFLGILQQALSYAVEEKSFLLPILRSGAAELVHEKFRAYYYKNIQNSLKGPAFAAFSDDLIKEVVRAMTAISVTETVYWLLLGQRESMAALKKRLERLHAYFTGPYLQERSCHLEKDHG